MEKFKAKDLNLVKTMTRNDKDLERSQVLIKCEHYLLYKKLPTLYLSGNSRSWSRGGSSKACCFRTFTKTTNQVILASEITKP